MLYWHFEIQLVLLDNLITVFYFFFHLDETHGADCHGNCCRILLCRPGSLCSLDDEVSHTGDV